MTSRHVRSGPRWWPWQTVLVDGAVEIRRFLRPTISVAVAGVSGIAVQCGSDERLILMGEAGEVLAEAWQWCGFSAEFCGALGESTGVQINYLPSAERPYGGVDPGG